MYFSNVSQISELKGQYRRLAARFHPDRGGCPELMTRINVEYEDMLASLKADSVQVSPLRSSAAHSARHSARQSTREGSERRERRSERRNRYFQQVEVGQIVFVNGTRCEVLEVTEDAFRAVAVGRTRQTWFNKSNGYGRFNKRFRAAWVEHNRRLR